MANGSTRSATKTVAACIDFGLSLFKVANDLLTLNLKCSNNCFPLFLPPTTLYMFKGKFSTTRRFFATNENSAPWS